MSMIASSQRSSSKSGSGVQHPIDVSTAKERAKALKKLKSNGLTLQECMEVFAAEERAEALNKLKSNGLTFVDCIKAFAASDEDPYVRKARSLVLKDSNLEIDGHTITSVGEEGAWVLSWLWVSNTDAGILYNENLLEETSNHTHKTLAGKRKLSADKNNQRDVQDDRLEDLMMNTPDKLDAVDVDAIRKVIQTE